MDRIHHDHQEDEGPIEIALVGDLTDHEGELSDRLLSVPPGGECTLFIDSPGGSPYCAIALTTLIRLRGVRATGIVIGECSSATLWPFAACERRIVTPYSVLLFHPMKWQSEEHVGLAEAAEWARHFGDLERDMDHLLAEMLGVEPDALSKWINPGRYISGREFAEAGHAELVPLIRPRKDRKPNSVTGNGLATETVTNVQKNGNGEKPASMPKAISSGSSLSTNMPARRGE